MKKTNALFMICQELARAFLNNYKQYTQMDQNLSKIEQRRQTKRMKSRIESISLAMRVTKRKSALDSSDRYNEDTQLSIERILNQGGEEHSSQNIQDDDME